MTVVLWILGILVALGLLIALTPVGVRVTFRNEDVTADVTVGSIHIRVFPGKEEGGKPPQQDDGQKEPPPEKDAKKKEKGPKMTFAEIRQMVRELWPHLKRALARTRRSIRVSPLQLSLIVGGEEDPAEAAQLYGELHGAVWTVMPVLEQLLVIRDPYIHLDIDFDTATTVAEGTVGVSMRIGAALRIVLGLAIPALRCLLAFRNRHKMQQPEPVQAGSVN